MIEEIKITNSDKYQNPKVRNAIRSVYRGVCQYCGREDADHVDHIEPRSKGGSDEIENLILSCDTCNIRKNNADLDPMFCAIAHSRARDKAGEIRLLLSQAKKRKSKKLIGFETNKILDEENKIGFSFESQHSTMKLYMIKNRIAFAEGIRKVGRPNWIRIAESLADLGLLDTKGRKPTKHTTRDTWRSICDKKRSGKQNYD